MKKIFTTLCVVILTFTLFAQAPKLMSYQAVIRDGSNQLISNQIIGVQVSILQYSPTGSTVYRETQLPTSNTNGLISIEIGNGTVLSGSIDSIDWAYGPYFLLTEIDPTGGSSYSISSNTQLLSVPYALSAGHLAITDENGNTYSPVVDTLGNVSYQTPVSSPLDKLVRREQFILNNMVYTKYVHSSEAFLDEKNGFYLYDCSGFTCEYVLKFAIPSHYQDLYNVYPTYHPADTRPRAWSFYDYFRDILGPGYDPQIDSTCSAQNSYWKVFTNIDSVQKGDIIAVRYHNDWRSWYHTTYGDWPSTGHIMTVWSAPLLTDTANNVYMIRILDSSNSGHGQDSRDLTSVSIDGSGYGYGWMLYKCSSYISNRPFEYKWTPSSTHWYELYNASTTDYTKIEGILFARPIE
ncbi:MAG: hypothetical protein JXR90_15680 [Spirochaetes bacterium]|nr:hypothetical protein [Spirochaetota bacterium]